MKRRFLLLTVLLSVAVMIFSTTAVSAASAQKVEFEPVRAPSKGPDNASVTVYEIGDFMWPFCKEVGPTFKKLYEEYDGKIRFVYVPYMRTYSHISRDTALASYAAWDQGKFWEMHDLLFENAPDLDRDVIDSLARKLGLDMDRFKKAMDNMEHLDELQGNLDRVHDLDVWSTPTVIINGTMIKGAQPYKNYKQLVDKALKETSTLERFNYLKSAFLGLIQPSKAYADGGAFGQGQVPLWVPAPKMKPTNDIRVGQEAPDFTLPSVLGGEITLSDFRGKKNVVISFLPAAFTPTWSGQMSAYEELKPRFAELDTQVLSVLVNNLPTLQAWSQGLNTSFPVLSDFWPHGQVALLYDVLRSEGIAERAIFVIDKEGIVRYVDIHDVNDDPGMNAILRTLKEIESK